MKKIFRILALIIVVLFGALSCKNAKADPAKEEKLKGYMLAGMYVISGYGGTAETENLAEEIGKKDKVQFIDTYCQLYVLPFSLDEGVETKNILSEWWGINSKEDLLASLKRLQSSVNEGNPHKAWDYSRAVNNINLGYAAGYLTEEEADSKVAALLLAAKADFETWKDYMADFIEGLKTWSPDDKRGIREFVDITEQMFVEEEGLYKQIPLN